MSGKLLTPVIQEFPSDGRIWRMDFLGGLERNPAMPDEPTVQVVISPLGDASLRDPAKLASVGAVVDAERITVRIGVGQLPYLKIGSLWRNGSCLPYGARKEHIFRLSVEKGTAGLFSAHRIVDDGPLVPPSHHRVGEAAGAFCVTVAYGGDPHGLIIPALELLRFYYAASTPLARAILMGDFFQNLNTLIDPYHSAYNLETSAVVLTVRRPIHDIEGWLIGRMLIAPEAKQCLKGLRISMVRQNAKGHKGIYPIARFPFSGPTSLKICCKPVKAADGRWRFLALSLEHCTAPFPFERLIVGRDLSRPDLEGVSSDAPDLNWLPAHMRKKPVTPSAKPTLQSKREPAKDREPTVFPALADAFAFLRNKKVEKLGREQLKSFLLHNSVESLSVFAEVFSTGEGGYASGNEVAPAEIQPRQRRKGLPADLKIFAELIEELNLLGTEASIREPSDEASCMPTQGMRRWCYLDYDLRIPREVAIGDVLFRKRWRCWKNVS